MSSAVNAVHVIGRLGRDPELRFTGSGKPVTNMSVAVNERFGDKEVTNWFRVVAWGKTAEACKQYLAQGSLVAVNGRLTSRSYEADGGTRYVTEIVVASIKFLSAPPAEADGEELPAPLEEEDIPF